MYIIGQQYDLAHFKNASVRAPQWLIKFARILTDAMQAAMSVFSLSMGYLMCSINA